MRACLTAALVLAAWIATPVIAASDPPGTLRVDYFHTGGRGVEIFALDRVTLEPLAARLRDVHARRSALLPCLPARARSGGRPVRGAAAH